MHWSDIVTHVSSGRIRGDSHESSFNSRSKTTGLAAKNLDIVEDTPANNPAPT
jgi:hypothetical protein